MIEHTTWNRLAKKLGAKTRRQTIKAIRAKAIIKYSQDGFIAIEWRQ